jgi:hypothetical protein
MYSQNSVGDIRRAIFDMQRPTALANNPMLQYAQREPRRRRSRALFAPDEDNDSMDLDTPARKLSRQVASSIMDDELDDMSTQSSPSNSQTMMFATNTHEINVDHHLMNAQYNPRIPTTATCDNLFYSNNSNESNLSADHYIQQQQHSSTFSSQTAAAAAAAADNNVYPSLNATASSSSSASSRQLPQQHIMYDPNSFVNQPQQHQASEMGLIGSPSTPRHVVERPHSVPFGATVMRTQSVSIPRVPDRPLGYASTFQLQNIMDESDGIKKKKSIRHFGILTFVYR